MTATKQNPTPTNTDNNQLLADFSQAVQTERLALSQVLDFINEIERRRLHLELGYASMFDFLVRAHQYSDAAAARRIAAARLLREAPVLTAQVQSGELNLSQMHLAQQMLRASELKLSPEQKGELLQSVAGKSKAQTESMLADRLNIAPPSAATAAAKKTVHHRDESVSLTLLFTKSQMQALKELLNLESHKVPDGDPAKVIALVIERELTRRRQQKPRATSPESRSQPKSQSDSQSEAQSEAQSHSQPQSESPQAPTPQRSRAGITPALRQALIQKHKHCQYQDRATGTRCCSTYQLQVDHLKPRWAGGSNEDENLTVLCAAHNRFRYQHQQAGWRRQPS